MARGLILALVADRRAGVLRGDINADYFGRLYGRASASGAPLAPAFLYAGLCYLARPTTGKVTTAPATPAANTAATSIATTTTTTATATASTPAVTATGAASVLTVSTVNAAVAPATSTATSTATTTAASAIPDPEDGSRLVAEAEKAAALAAPIGPSVRVG